MATNIVSIMTAAVFLTYRNVHQFICTEHKAPDNSEVYSSLQDCGPLGDSEVYTSLHDCGLLGDSEVYSSLQDCGRLHDSEVYSSLQDCGLLGDSEVYSSLQDCGRLGSKLQHLVLAHKIYIWLLHVRNICGTFALQYV